MARMEQATPVAAAEVNVQDVADVPAAAAAGTADDGGGAET
jgi:hypothetical protein